MIFEQPKPGDKLEYYNGASWFNIKQDNCYWDDAGEIVAVVGNICYSFDPKSKVTHEEYFGVSPIPHGCERANSGFIWRFHDGNNKLFRIKN